MIKDFGRKLEVSHYGDDSYVKVVRPFSDVELRDLTKESYLRYLKAWPLGHTILSSPPTQLLGFNSHDLLVTGEALRWDMSEKWTVDDLLVNISEVSGASLVAVIDVRSPDDYKVLLDWAS